MTGIEIAVATYLFTWAKRRGKPLAERAGQEADTAAGLLMDRLHQLVADKMGPQSRGLGHLEREAAAGAEELSGTSEMLMSASLAAAMEDDPGFAAILRQVVADLQTAERKASDRKSGLVSGDVFYGPAAVQTGSHNRQINHFGN